MRRRGGARQPSHSPRSHAPRTAIHRETSRSQRRASARAVTRVHHQPAHTLALHLVRAQLLQQPPLVNHAEAGGDARDLAEQVARQEDGDALLMRQLAQQLADLDDTRRVQPVGWLVEEQESRIVQQRLRQPQPLRIAQRERPSAPVGIGAKR